MIRRNKRREHSKRRNKRRQELNISEITFKMGCLVIRLRLSLNRLRGVLCQYLGFRLKYRTVQVVSMDPAVLYDFEQFCARPKLAIV